jgi:MFS transporter, DHA1 family, inner membrane transport protein
LPERSCRIRQHTNMRSIDPSSSKAEISILGFPPAEIEVLASLWFMTFVCMADNNIMAVLIPHITDHFSLSDGYVGAWVKSSFAIGAGVGSLLCGPLSDRWGRYHFLLFGGIFFSAFSFVTWWAPSFHIVAVSRCLTGFATGALTLNIVSYMGDVIPYSRRGVAMGIIMSAFFSGMIIGVPAAAYLAAFLNSWNAIFLIFGILSLCSTLSVYFLLSHHHFTDEHRLHPGRTSMLRRSLDTYKRLLCYGPTLAGILSITLGTAGMYGLITYTASFLKVRFGFEPEASSTIFLLTGPVSLIMAPLAGRIADRTTKRSVVLFSSFVLFLSILCFPFFISKVAFIYLGFALCFGASAARMGAINAILTHLVPHNRRASLLALRNLGNQVGVVLGAVVGGILYDSRFGYTGICYFSMFLLALSFLAVYFWLPEPSGIHENPDEVFSGIASEPEVLT